MPHSEKVKTVPGGFLVAFEGTDGAGKTTQALAVCETLKTMGYECIYLREPTNGPVGRRLRELMIQGRVSPEEEFRLFLEDRTEDVQLNIAPALARGDIVCIDRYYISSMAYQGALGLDPKFIQIENEKIAPRPDLILVFELPVEESLQRIRSSREAGENLFEKQQYQERVHAMFAALDLPNVVRIDARAAPDLIEQGIIAEISWRVKRRLDTHQ